MMSKENMSPIETSSSNKGSNMENPYQPGRDPFGLASLPELHPPVDGWGHISARLKQERHRKQRWFAALAIAASVMLASGIVLYLPGPGENPDSLGMPQTEQIAVETGSTAQEIPLEQAPDSLQSLKNLSQRLEENLRYLRSSVGAMPAEIVVYQVELEDLVAQVDGAISLQPDSSELWRQRVNLLMDLNQVYSSGLRRDYQQVASL